jgi:DNA-binding transcriptional regulator YhcF (GntR family)
MSVKPIELTLDRDLPIPLGVQLRGLLEYGIVCGELRPGDRLPSVRELAGNVGVAPMTVAEVYNHLKAAGLIEGRAGSGTFVAKRNALETSDSQLTGFHRRIDALIDEGLAIGLSGDTIASFVAARLSARQAHGRTRRLVVVGIFAAATASYARAIAQALGPRVTVESVTLEALSESEALRDATLAADLVLTPAHCRRQVSALAPRQRVVTISFIPSESTRRSLASLDPRARVLVVSRFPEFLALMRPGVMRFAPHVSSVEACVLDAEDLETRLKAKDVVIYATGAETVLAKLQPGVLAIEYRHSPDPVEIDRVVRPLLEGGEPNAEAAHV